MEELHLFTSSCDETKQVARCLEEYGCCPRCILRFMGETRASSYNCTPQELEKLLLLKESKDSQLEVEIGSCPCPLCLGILQKFTTTDFFARIEEVVTKAGYEFSTQQCSLIVPVSIIIREKAMLVQLKKKFGVTYTEKEGKIASVKDVWKWSCGRRVGELFGVQFQNRSPFDILMTFNYPDSDKECSFLLDAEPEKFRRRKQRKFGFETFTRAGVAKALTEMSESKFEDNFQCPPNMPTVECTCEIQCSHDAVFIAGRYQKYSRVLSQTPWVVGGKRIMEGSVEEIICEPITALFSPKEHKLSSSGREDVDVRMLGLGRPFVVELIDPHKTNFSPEQMAQLQQEINKSSTDVQVRDLQIVTREDIVRLKEGEENKTKCYRALCWCERELSDKDMDMLRGLKDLTLKQKTPLRVFHRRSASTREKVIHSLGIEKLADNRFNLSLKTQAGTYVKEFVHGDFGRTSPNMSELLGADCDIIDLDVEAVDVDWPPFIDPVPPEQATNSLTTHTSQENANSITETMENSENSTFTEYS